MSAAAVAAAAASNEQEQHKGRVSEVRVKRYWPGKAPDWAGDESDEEPEALAPQQKAEAPGYDRKDARLERIAESRKERQDAIARHREIRAAEVISTEAREEAEAELRAAQAERSQPAAEEDEDEDTVEARRARARERQQKRQEAELLATAGAEEEDEAEEEEEESEYETDSSEENERLLVKPVFVPKAERETIAEREKFEAEERERLQKEKELALKRKEETRTIVVEIARQEAEAAANATAREATLSDVDTDDEANEAEEYELWKVREMARIKRFREERERLQREQEEVEKLRNMTEEQRREYERKNPKQGLVTAQRKKWKFLQKYYHKGAFFQEDADDTAGTAGTAEIFKRDFSDATGEDRMDKSILPKVMQVKHFGRSGRTKWTHLVAEDTTSWDNPWTFNDPLRQKYTNKMAGMKNAFDKPKGKKLSPR
eukprot:jgi/Chlat1/599/Chrsp103S00949